MSFEFPALKAAKGELDAARKELQDVFREAGKDYDFSQVKSLSGDNAEKLDWVRSKNDEIEAKAAEVAKLESVQGIAAKRLSEMEERSAEQDEAPQGRKSLGEAFQSSNARKSFRPGMREGAMSTVDFDVKALFETTAGIAPETTRTGQIVDFATRPAPNVVNSITQVNTNQSAVVYLEETTFGNAAAETAEGGAYAESTLVYTERNEPVRKIATYMAMTDEQLEDVSYALSRVNQRLPFMVAQRVDQQVLLGNGTAPNLRGTLNVAGIQTQDASVTSGDATQMLDHILVAANKVRTSAFAEPSVLFVHPMDWQKVQLMKTADGVYLWGAPQSTGPLTAWGMPVHLTTALPQGTAVLGDYRNYAELAVRRGIDMQITNSHEDYFTHGKQAIRADVRVAMVHLRPSAFCEITGL